jgi:ATP-dependent DNA helicase PIF1
MAFVNKQIKSNQVVADAYQDMLNDFLGEGIVKFDENLSKMQKVAFEKFKKGENLLIISEAGCGKSKLIKTMEEYVKINKPLTKISLSSTTGISAYNITGVTVNSLMGIGSGEQDVEYLIKKVYRNKTSRMRILCLDILVIDESSMLSADLLEKLNIICQNIRKNKLFFGGIQVVFSMDPLQLSPVFNKNMDLYKNSDTRLLIESVIFNKEFNKKKKNIIVLTENFRQQLDPEFINLLSRLRLNELTKEDVEKLNKRKFLPKDKIYVNLVTSNKKAQIINDNELNKLRGQSIKFVSQFKSEGTNKDIEDLILKELHFQFKQKGLNELILKKNARVMLVKNLNVEIGLVNGALGTIIDFIGNEKNPLVKFDNNQEVIIEPSNWEIEIDDCKGVACQIPLMLAYSLTIHKCQSLTLENAILDLDDCFCDGQIYVAISRLKSINGIFFKSFDDNKITVNKKMKDYCKNL